MYWKIFFFSSRLMYRGSVGSTASTSKYVAYLRRGKLFIFILNASKQLLRRVSLGYLRLLNALVELGQRDLGARVRPLLDVALRPDHLLGVIGIEGRVEIQSKQLVVQDARVEGRQGASRMSSGEIWEKYSFSLG